jgi:putative PIG3 family NAD(P)H quinone oxidoreductase
MMQAVRVVGGADGQPDTLALLDEPQPSPGPGQLLIEVHASGVNRADILQRRGAYPPPEGASHILGLECAGRVAATGPGVDPGWVGRSVAALVAGGAYADYCIADESLVLDTGDVLSPVAAAALPEALATVWMILFHAGRVTADDTVLIQGGTGGIGSTAIQVARWRGCRVLATAGTAGKRAVLDALGVQVSLDHTGSDLADQVLAATQGVGVDAVLDYLGPNGFDTAAQYLAPYGQILCIGSQKGRVGDVDMGPLMNRQATVRFASLRRTPAPAKAAIMAAVREQLWPRVLAGEISSLIDSVHPIQDAAEAHRAFEAGGHIGKIVLLHDGRQAASSVGVHPLSTYGSLHNDDARGGA